MAEKFPEARQTFVSLRLRFPSLKGEYKLTLKKKLKRRYKIINMTEQMYAEWLQIISWNNSAIVCKNLETSLRRQTCVICKKMQNFKIFSSI